MHRNGPLFDATLLNRHGDDDEDDDTMTMTMCDVPAATTVALVCFWSRTLRETFTFHLSSTLEH